MSRSIRSRSAPGHRETLERGEADEGDRLGLSLETAGSSARQAGTWGESATECWRNRKTLILSWSDMVGLLTPAEYVDCVEHAFRMHGLGRVYMEPKGHIVLDRTGASGR